MKKKLQFDIEGLQLILEVFRKHNAHVRLIGGCVRDAILGIKYSDIDLATNLLPQAVSDIFEKEKFKVIPTGIDFGTVTILASGNNFEVTTLRKDIKTDGRHAIVEYTDDFEIDASRRDFTINALSYDPFSEKIYDYYDGLKDLKNRIVKFIGNADERIIEDYLRIMRFFRFSSYYADSLNLEGLNSCKKNIQGLAIISKERINLELSKILNCLRPIKICLQAMFDANIFEIIAPTIQFDLQVIYKFEDKLENFIEYELDAKKIRLALLTSNLTKKEAKDFLKDLRFSRVEMVTNEVICDFISALSDSEQKDEVIFEICKGWYYFPEYIKIFLIISYVCEKIEIEDMKNNIVYMKSPAPRMPITSEELMELGYEGLSLGLRIKFLEKQWIKSGFSATKDKLIEMK